MLETHLASAHQGYKSFLLPGFCVPCGVVVDFVADFAYAWTSPTGLLVPNWRESLRCPLCGMNSRQRMMVQLITEHLMERRDGATVYFMEQLSPVYEWAARTFRDVCILGSEYLGPSVERGASVSDVRNEDAEHLSFTAASIDLLVSCDVLEHVNAPDRAFEEIARVLKPGGVALLTFPMDPQHDANTSRATIRDGRVQNLLPPVYHGNPLSKEGSLVFTDFGWEVLRQIAAARLPDPAAVIYWSYERAYLGIQMYFRAVSPCDAEHPST